MFVQSFSVLCSRMKRSPMVRAVLPPLMIHLLVVFFIAFLTMQPSGFPQSYSQKITGMVIPSYLSQFSNWDGQWYLRIAQNGYYVSDFAAPPRTAFFPLFPLTLRLLHTMGIPYQWVGLIVANVALFFALVFLYRLALLDFGRTRAKRVLWLLAFYPMAVFFSVTYSESLFLALSLATFWFARQSRWWMAGLIGGLAALTRNIGILLFLPVAYEWWRSRPPKSSFRSILPVLLIPSGLLLYSLFLWYAYEQPLAFLEAQAHWGRSPTFPGFSVIFAAIDMVTNKNQGHNNRIDLPLMLLVIGALYWAWKQRLRSSYLIYACAVLLAVLGTWSHSYGALYSTSRLCMVIFPIYLALSRWRGQRFLMLLCLFAPLFGLYVVLFAKGFWVN